MVTIEDLWKYDSKTQTFNMRLPVAAELYDDDGYRKHVVRDAKLRLFDGLFEDKVVKHFRPFVISIEEFWRIHPYEWHLAGDYVVLEMTVHVRQVENPVNLFMPHNVKPYDELLTLKSPADYSTNQFVKSKIVRGRRNIKRRLRDWRRAHGR